MWWVRVHPGKQATCVDWIGGALPLLFFISYLTLLHPMTTISNPSPQLLTVRELAALLRISLTSVYRLVERRAIRFFRFPHGIRFRIEDVECFLAGLLV